MKPEIKVALIVGATKALEFKKLNPRCILDEAIQSVMNQIEDKEDVKIAAITGASKAFELRERNPRISDKEILNQVMKQSDLILKDIVPERK